MDGFLLTLSENDLDRSCLLWNWLGFPLIIFLDYRFVSLNNILDLSGTDLYSNVFLYFQSRGALMVATKTLLTLILPSLRNGSLRSHRWIISFFAEWYLAISASICCMRMLSGQRSIPIFDLALTNMVVGMGLLVNAEQQAENMNNVSLALQDQLPGPVATALLQEMRQERKKDLDKMPSPEESMRSKLSISSPKQSFSSKNEQNLPQNINWDTSGLRKIRRNMTEPIQPLTMNLAQIATLPSPPRVSQTAISVQETSEPNDSPQASALRSLSILSTELANGLVKRISSHLTPRTESLSVILNQGDGSEVLGLVNPQLTLQTLLSSELEDQAALEGGRESNSAIYVEHHSRACILFADLVGFTTMSSTAKPDKVVELLHSLFSRFDRLFSTAQGHVFKIDIVGDCYMVASGLTGMHDADPNPAQSLFRFGKTLVRTAAKINDPITGEPLKMRVGIHKGPVVAALIGSLRRKYSVFGDSVNVASRLESTGQAGAIHVSRDVYESLLPPRQEVQTDLAPTDWGDISLFPIVQGRIEEDDDRGELAIEEPELTLMEGWQRRGKVELKGRQPVDSYLFIC